MQHFRGSAGPRQAPVASEQTAKMPEMVTVEGMDLNPDDFDGAGWTTALGARRKRDPAKNAAAPAAAKTTANTAQKDDFNARSRSTVQKVVAASRLPRLPKDQIKVIVRPRGGLDVSKADLVLLARALTMAAALTDQEASEDTICPNKVQNILVISTPVRSNAVAYAGIQKIHTKVGAFEVSAYVAAPENTCKGVIRNVDPSIEDHTLRSMIVNQRNPTAIEVKRIKNTHVVVILFDGLRVPKNVMCGTALVPCSLYKRQVDVCHACGRVGHRADVCHHSKEERSKCHNCGEALPNGAAEAHSCTPKCKLCEGDHPTGDRCCSKRFHIPYVVRRRRRQRQNRSEKEVNPDEVKDPADMHQEVAEGAIPKRRSSSRGRSCSTGRSRSRSKSAADGAGPTEAARSRSSSRQPGKKMTWADMVGDSGSAPTTSKQGKAQPEHVADPRIHTLERENKALKQELAELRATLARLEGRLLKNTPPPIPQSSGTVVASCSSHKRRAVDIQTDDDTSDVDDFMSEVSEAPSNASTSDNKAKKRHKTKSKFSTFQSAITDIKEALMHICGRLDRLERPIAQPKAKRTMSTADTGPQPALSTPSQPPGPIGEVDIHGVMPKQHHG